MGKVRINPKEFIPMYTGGIKIKELAKYFGCSETSIATKAKVLGIKRDHLTKGSRWPAEDIERLRVLRKAGLRPIAISEIMGRSAGSISGAISRFQFGAEVEPSTLKIPKIKPRDVTFYPPPWSKKMDIQLYRAGEAALEERGSIYGVICEFASARRLSIDAVQRRWHLIARTA